VQNDALAKHPDPLYHYEWLDSICLHDPVLWRCVAAHPRLLEIARAVLGEAVFPTNGAGFFLKPPGSSAPVPWHQDASPFGHGQGAPLLFDFWLGLSRATETMGCLRLIPRSQSLGRVPHELKPGGLHEEVTPAEHGYEEGDVVYVETEPGDLVVWHQDMFHGSLPNRGDEPRVAIAAIYHGQAEEDALRQQHRKGAIRQRPQLCHGTHIFDLPADQIIPAIGPTPAEQHP
jgi:phytanoyl-CoA hydroxylase